jgi:hypothetical protein
MGMKKLGTGAITTGGGTLLYTVPTGIRVEVRDIIATNTTGGALGCTLYFVPVGGSVSAANMVLSAKSVSANDIFQWQGIQVLNAGDFIQGIGSGAGLTVHITGDEYRAGT